MFMAHSAGLRWVVLVNISGFGKENIGRNSKFLQGPETEGYLVEEIMHALQQHEPLCIKLHNHKADGRKFQNLLCLHPVFGREGEYLYQVRLHLQGLRRRISHCLSRHTTP